MTMDASCMKVWWWVTYLSSFVLTVLMSQIITDWIEMIVSISESSLILFSFLLLFVLSIWDGFELGRQSIVLVQDPNSHVPPCCLLVLFLCDTTSTPLLFTLQWYVSLNLAASVCRIGNCGRFVLLLLPSVPAFNILSFEFTHCQYF